MKQYANNDQDVSNRETEPQETKEELKSRNILNTKLSKVLDRLIDFNDKIIKEEKLSENITPKKNNDDNSDFKLFRTSVKQTEEEILKEILNKRKRPIIESSSDSSDEDERVSSVCVNAADIMKFASLPPL